jgi:hypothetical protein
MKAIEPTPKQELFLRENIYRIHSETEQLAYEMKYRFGLNFKTAKAIIINWVGSNMMEIVGYCHEEKEDEIKPSHRLTYRFEEIEVIEPLNIEPIPGTKKVIVTYPSRV